MQKPIPYDDIEKIYSEAVPEIRAQYGDAVADLAQYHKATFQRPEQLIGDSAIKKSDVTITDDFVTVRGVTKGKKNRPNIKYPIGSPMADLIIRNYESSASDKLFDVTQSTYDKAYRTSISPRLLAGFEDFLPLFDAKDPSKGVITSPSATRSFMSVIVRDELGYPTDVTEAMMGHTDSSILSRNYAGFKPFEGLGKIADDLLIGVRDKFGGFGEDASNFTSTLTEEERRELAKAQVAEAKNKTENYLSDTLKKQKERIEFLQSEEGQKFLEGQDAIERQQITRELELEQFKKAERARLQPETAPAPKQITVDDDMKKGMSKLLDFFRNIDGGKMAQGAVTVGGTALIGASLMPRIAEAQKNIEEGKPVVPSVLEQAGQFILEESPVGIMQAGVEVGKDVVGAALEPVAKEIEEQAEEAGLRDDIEGQMSRMFGIQ